MSFLVYKVTCEANGKAYIGVTRLNEDQRLMRHKRLARLGHTGMPLYDAIRAFGGDVFTTEVLYEASSQEEMYLVERALIAAHGTMVPRGYNLARGGFGGFHSISAAGRLSRSRKMKARWADPEYRARVSAALRSANTPEVIAKRGAAVKAARSTPESRAKTSAQLRRDRAGRDVYTPARIEKYKASMQRHWGDPEFRKRLGYRKSKEIA